MVVGYYCAQIPAGRDRATYMYNNRIFHLTLMPVNAEFRSDTKLCVTGLRLSNNRQCSQDNGWLRFDDKMGERFCYFFFSHWDNSLFVVGTGRVVCQSWKRSCQKVYSFCRSCDGHRTWGWWKFYRPSACSQQSGNTRANIPVVPLPTASRPRWLMIPVRRPSRPLFAHPPPPLPIQTV